MKIKIKDKYKKLNHINKQINLSNNKLVNNLKKENYYNNNLKKLIKNIMYYKHKLFSEIKDLIKIHKIYHHKMFLILLSSKMPSNNLIL